MIIQKATQFTDLIFLPHHQLLVSLVLQVPQLLNISLLLVEVVLVVLVAMVGVVVVEVLADLELELEFR